MREAAARASRAGRSFEIGDIRALVHVFVFAGATADMERAHGLFRVLFRGGFQFDDDGGKRNRLPAMTAEHTAV